MKTTRLYTLFALLMVFAVSCNKPDEPNNGGNNNGQNDSIVDPNNGGGNNGNNDNDVRVTTYTPQDITATTAKCGGDVIVTQGLSLTELGICWSTERNPSANDVHIATVDWETPFVCTLTGLEPETKYYVRAYALRGIDYYYGDEMSFITETNGGGGNSGGGIVNGHSYIDLGLPSGTLWATCNIGAELPENVGDLFAWGETEPKTIYDWSTYKYCRGDRNTLTKYCNKSNYGYNGFTDELVVLQANDDAATENWGFGWRTPSTDEWYELFSVCEWTYTGDGWSFIGPNSNCVFVPDNSAIANGYWSNTISNVHPYDANLWKYLDNHYFLCSRCEGCSIRPVCSTK